MRELKFRAWVELDNGCSEDDPAHYTKKIMCPVEYLSFDEMGIRDVIIIDDYMRDCESLMFDIEDVELMQFTGLKDKDELNMERECFKVLHECHVKKEG